MATPQIDLVRRYEPILYFDPAEAFVPCDPKAYLEACALWRSRAPGTGADDWGEEPPGALPKTPMVPAGGLAALKDEETAGRQWLGNLLPGGSGEDRFLDPAGWADAARPDTGTVTRYGDRDEVAARYAVDGPNRDVLFRYYAEILDGAELQRLVEAAPPAGFTADTIKAILDQLARPQRLILYHLFFPAHDEDLEGCAGYGEAEHFAEFVGEWACVAVFQENDTPTYIGVTRRNVGPHDPADDGTRLGMVVAPWSQVSTVDGFPDHPRIVVSRGTHGLYLDVDTTGPRPVAPFGAATPDVGRQSCGQVEQVDGVVAGFNPNPNTDVTPDVAVVLLKFLSVASVFGIGAALIAGNFWFMAEIGDVVGYADPVPTPEDVTPTPATSPPALTVGPQGVLPDGHVWPTDETAAPGGAVRGPDGRRYPFIVNRDTQVWWPPAPVADGPTGTGYAGRWGPAVAQDPMGRRSGMRVPPFWQLFVAALARTKA